MKKIFLSLFILLSSTIIKAAEEDWTLHTSYHNATYCEVIGDKVYVLASGALYSYNKEDDEVRTYDMLSTLSDIKISFISYCKEIDALVIVYENANIDLLYSDEEVYNISDFKDKTIANKTINGLDIKGDKAYLSTGFGIVEVDLSKKEFSNTYTLNKNVYNAYPLGNYMYAATSEGLFYGSIESNLLDNSNWKLFNANEMKSFVEFGGKLHFLYQKKYVCYIDPATNSIKHVNVNDKNQYSYLYSNGKELIAGSKTRLLITDSNNKQKTFSTEESNFIKTDGNVLWNCKGYKGLKECKIDNSTIVESENGIIPESPVRNYSEFMKISGNKLLVAGGNINYMDITFYDGTLMEYDLSDGKWTNYPEDIIKENTGYLYRNICTVDEDPTEEGHIFAGSFGHGLYEFRNHEFVKNYTIHNSPIESVVSGESAIRYMRVPMVKYDNKGNLWVINTGMKNIIKILKKDGTWLQLYYKLIDSLPTVSNIHVDSRGWMWLVSMRADAGLFCAKTNGTLFDTSDDESKVWFEKFINQDGISYTVYEIYGFAEDKNGVIWVGTNTGLFVIDNPKEFFENGKFTQIKVPRNDGTGLADYLLNGTYIQCITVDGANRKWIGTKHNGVYLISEDGLETIEHFTTENSPLPSNSVVSVAVNGHNGEVFFGTENGIASYKGDATEPVAKLDENSIYAYPNPVKADYSGDIRVVGLTYDCNVKIVDAAGSLIYEATSTGGSFSWDGRDRKGDKVASGVYYVLTYDENGDEGVATKILFIR